MISVIWNRPSVIDGMISALRPDRGEQPGRPPADAHDVAAAEGGQPAQRHGEQIDQQDADQEGRQRDSDQRDRLEELGEQAVRAAAPSRRPSGCRTRSRRPWRRTASSSVAGMRSASRSRPAGGTDRRRRNRLAPPCRDSARTAPAPDRRGRATCRICARSAAGVSMETIWFTGSPAKRNIEKAMMPTANMTPMAWNARRR